MVEVIPKHIKDAWDTWNIRGMIILSLSLQTILILFAPTRKRTPNKFIIMLLWSSYLLADFSANFAVALIAKNQGKVPKPDDPPQDKKLVALWAPFLLLHLGGPDTITAFSLEDNALWNRHFLGLVFQALAGVYVVVQSLPNVLWLIILLLFIAGTSKYLERTIALYLASSDNFRGSMLQVSSSGFDYTGQTKNLDMELTLDSEMYMKERQGELKPLRLRRPLRKLADLEILQYAFFFFNNFKSLMVNNIFSLDLRDESKAFFSPSRLPEEERLRIIESLRLQEEERLRIIESSRLQDEERLRIIESLRLQEEERLRIIESSRVEDEEALRIIEAELELIYEGLYTKGAVLHSWLGLVSRIISLGSLLSAFGIFHYRQNKIQEFHKADIVITYALFLVGIALDVISINRFMVSEWTIAILSKLEDDPEEMFSRRRDTIFDWILSLKRPKWKTQTCGEQHHQEVLNTPFLLRRWTGSIKMFNFITYSVNAETEKIHSPRGTTCQQHLWNIRFSYAISVINTWSGNIAMWFRDLHQHVLYQVINLSPRENQVTQYIINIFKNFVDFWFHVPYVFSFLGTCLINLLGITDLFNEIRLVRSVHSEPLTRSLWCLIFSELKKKSQNLDSLDNTKANPSARRGWVSSNTHTQIADKDILLRYITDVDYDHSLLIWHIATELCYQKEAPAKENCNDRDISKMLSDYMMYLLIKQPKLVSEVAGIGKIRFRDTLAEAERLFKRKGIHGNAKLASKTILCIDTSIEPRYVKGTKSKSVLFEASSLAKELQRQDENVFGQEKWKTLSKVWLEFLFHAASHSDGTTRLELLSKGGEFINFVWLLMAHFGLGD